MKMVRLILAVSFFIGGCFLSAASAEEVKTISKEELKSMLSDTSVVVVDVRTGADWKSADFKIKGAVREDPSDVDNWMHKFGKDKTLVFYCA